MVRVIVFYDTKYGNTKLVAEKIAEGLGSVEGVMVNLGNVKDGLADAQEYDAIVLGAPNHMASPSRAMQTFVELLAHVNLKAKAAAVFGTYAGRERTVDRAVKKLENQVQAKLPNLKLLTPTLSVRVKGVKGPIVNGEFSKSLEYGGKIAVQLKA